MNLVVRPRRLRQSAAVRSLAAETRLDAAELVLPLFVKEGIPEPRPVVSSRYSQAVRYAPRERSRLSFVLAKGQPGVSDRELCRRIHEQTGLQALTRDEFAWKTIRYFPGSTGIPVNFGITIVAETPSRLA